MEEITIAAVAFFGAFASGVVAALPFFAMRAGMRAALEAAD